MSFSVPKAKGYEVVRKQLLHYFTQTGEAKSHYNVHWSMNTSVWKDMRQTQNINANSLKTLK